MYSFIKTLLLIYLFWSDSLVVEAHTL